MKHIYLENIYIYEQARWKTYYSKKKSEKHIKSISGYFNFTLNLMAEISKVLTQVKFNEFLKEELRGGEKNGSKGKRNYNGDEWMENEILYRITCVELIFKLPKSWWELLRSE